MEIKYAGFTDVGCVRKNNEDTFFVDLLADGRRLLAVAVDGLGGYEAGEVAAQIACDAVVEYVKGADPEATAHLLRRAVVYANNRVCQARKASPTYAQMGCVLTAALVYLDRQEIEMAHVGDSRMYQCLDGTLTKLSHDQSPVGRAEDCGALTEYQAMHHPQRNIISNALGFELLDDDTDYVENAVFPLMPGMQLLLCSDGLTDLVPAADIRQALILPDVDPDYKAQLLVELAKRAGGKDNITAVVVHYAPEQQGTYHQLQPDDDDKPLTVNGMRLDTLVAFLAGVATIAAMLGVIVAAL